MSDYLDLVEQLLGRPVRPAPLPYPVFNDGYDLHHPKAGVGDIFVEDDAEVARLVCSRTKMDPATWAGLSERERLSWLRQALAPATPVATATAKGKRGRPTKSEKDSATKVVAALCAHHGYDAGSITNYTPASNRQLADPTRGIAANALTRFFADKGGMKAYQRMCAKRDIGNWLMVWQREMPTHQPALRSDD